MIEEHPQLVEALEQVATQRGGGGVRRPLPVFEGFLHGPRAVFADVVSHGLALGGAVAVAVPVMKHVAQRGSQPLADPGSIASHIEQALNVSLEMSPADLPAGVEAIVRGITIGADRSREGFTQPCDRDGGRARQPDDEDGERLGHGTPQPGLVGSLPEGRFVAADRRGTRQCGRQFVVARLQRGCGPLLLLDHQSGTARHAEQSFQGQGPCGVRTDETGP